MKQLDADLTDIAAWFLDAGLVVEAQGAKSMLIYEPGQRDTRRAQVKIIDDDFPTAVLVPGGDVIHLGTHDQNRKVRDLLAVAG